MHAGVGITAVHRRQGRDHRQFGPHVLQRISRAFQILDAQLGRKCDRAAQRCKPRLQPLITLAHHASKRGWPNVADGLAERGRQWGRQRVHPADREHDGAGPRHRRPHTRILSQCPPRVAARPADTGDQLDVPAEFVGHDVGPDPWVVCREAAFGAEIRQRIREYEEDGALPVGTFRGRHLRHSQKHSIRRVATRST